MKRFFAIILLAITATLCGCGIFDFIKPVYTEESSESMTETATEAVTEEKTTEEPTEITTEKSTEAIDENAPTFLDGYIFPVTDGSTSTTNLDKAVREALLGTSNGVAHSTTYQSFYNLLENKAQVIFTTPLSKDQLDQMERENFTHEAEPVAGEGFVFVVNKDNPVDTLTVEQIKGIYSGEITNWKDVGGDDAEIIAYQRNRDSGSQNYMLAFMGDTPLMDPVTEFVPGAMSTVLDAVANYDNSKYAIGYSVYAYSDGMYENISKIKYVKVNGVEPTFKAMADGAYPLLGYNYAVFSADEPEDSSVRALVKWIQSDEGQQVLANAGYVPYRQVEGLTLPDETAKKLYYSVATSNIQMPEEPADYYYYTYDVSSDFTTEALGNKVQEFVKAATAELSLINPDDVRDFNLKRFDYLPEKCSPTTYYRLNNGYLSVKVAIMYYLPVQDGEYYYYDARCAVFDIYTGKRLEFSDLFFDGVDFVPLVNELISRKAELPYSGYGALFNMVSDFKGLYEGDFEFTANSIIFRPGISFADGVELDLSELYNYMVTSIPRDMSGIIDEDIPVYMDIEYLSGITDVEEIEYNLYYYPKAKIQITHLNPEKAPASIEIINKFNSIVDDWCEIFFDEGKLLEHLKTQGITADSVRVITPYPSIGVGMIGHRIIEVYTPASFIVVSDGEETEIKIDGNYNSSYYYNAKTGEELKLDDLFKDGWRDDMIVVVDNKNFSEYDKKTWVEYTGDGNIEYGKITEVYDFAYAPRMYGDKRDKEIPACVYLTTENGDKVVVLVPQKYR